MKRIDGCIAFGFFPGAPYDFVTDELATLEGMKNRISRDTIIRHIEALSPAISSVHGKSVYTGKDYQASIFEDGEFVFPIDVLIYLKEGRIGIPAEYENYLHACIEEDEIEPDCR